MGQGRQHFMEGIVDWNLTGLARLRGGVAWGDEPVFHINVSPPETENLAAPHTGVQGGQDNRI
jgi:hypothetical protein